MKPRIRSMIWEMRKQNQNKTKNQSEQPEEKRIQRNDHSVSSIWDSFKRCHIGIIDVPEGEEKEQEIGNRFQTIMEENFFNLKEIDVQVQEVQRVPHYMDAQRPTLRHIIIKMPKVKDKERILQAVRAKQVVTYSKFP